MPVENRMSGQNLRIVAKLLLSIFSIFLVLIFLELSLWIGGAFINKPKKDVSQSDKKVILFAGDSWCQGSDADPGKDFFDLLREDKEFKDDSFVNLGYGANNPFQVVNSVISYKNIPGIAVIIMGTSTWHLMGFEKFVNIAKDYFLLEDVKNLYEDFKLGKLERQFLYLTKLKMYKLYQYLIGGIHSREEIDMKILDQKLRTGSFSQVQIRFREKYYDRDERIKRLPSFLHNCKELSLDQNFFFTIQEVGLDTQRAEEVLTKAGIFYPDKLTVVPYSVYKRLDRLDVSKKRIINRESCFMKWSFKLLKLWSEKNNVTIYVQTYPDIRNKEGENSPFYRINKEIKHYAAMHNFKLIDHNKGAVDWSRYRTCWHVNNEGHRIMKDLIKIELSPVN